MSRQLGVLAMYLEGRKLEELAFYRKLCIFGKKLGLEIVVFTPDDVDEAKGRIHALTYRPADGRWVRKWTGFPSLIYDRRRYHGASNFRKLSGFRKKYVKLTYLSRPLANKWTVHQRLAEDEKIAPYLPVTIHYNSTKDLTKMLKQFPVLFMKPKSGTGGRGSSACSVWTAAAWC
ncbi:hypothetical protein LJK88_38020 [Paenibacillus sp. P26]|nr:hypothetical protein LJK88_38020 [Paenibacillus sp. P26]